MQGTSTDPIHPALGLDFGTARIGVAATDPLGILAHPVETIDCRRTAALDRIAELVAVRRIRTLVVGLPLRVDGSEGDAAAKVRAFAVQLAARLPALPMVFVDEAFTTAEAADRLRAAGRKARCHRPVIDQAAAVAILDRWLGWDGQADPGSSPGPAVPPPEPGR